MSEYFSLSYRVIFSDAFLKMSNEAMLLYIHLCSNANAKGIVGNAKATARSLDIDYEAIDDIVRGGFIIPCNDGEYLIIHHRENNGYGEVSKKRISYQYRQWRVDVLKRDGYECQTCGSKENLVIHHIVPFAESEELRTVVSNGVTLCDSCHKKLHKELRNV